MLYKNIYLLLSIIFLGCNYTESKIPLDENIVKDFVNKKNNYVTAVKYILENKIIHFKYNNRTKAITVRPESFSNEQLAQLKFLIKDTLNIDRFNVRFKEQTYDTIEEVYFYTYSSGYVSGGQVKGVSYSLKKKNENIVSSIDDIQAKIIDHNNTKLVSGIRIYKGIIDNWYIFYEYDD